MDILDEKSIKSVTLTLTEECNLNCTYCYEHNKTAKSMSFATAKNVVDYELNDTSVEYIYLDFFGGEPFLKFDLLKEIVEYVESKNFPTNFICFATTNGTLVHGEIQEWLKRRTKSFKCGISLDGTRSMHNINRCNSFDDIDIEFFKKFYPEQGVKMTISQETLPKLAEGVIFIHNCGFEVNCNLAFGIDWSITNNEKILERELSKLMDYYFAHPEIKPCSMLDNHIYCDNGAEKKLFRKWCGTGTHMHTYDVDGQVYPCQFFMPISAGKDKASEAKDIKFYNVIPEELIDEKCRTCVISDACPSCYGSNYVSSGNIYHKDDNQCKLTKIIVKARSFFKARLWEMKRLKLKEGEEYNLLQSIIKIQNELIV